MKGPSEGRGGGEGRGSKFGIPLETKRATSVSTISLAVAVGGEVKMALPIDAVYEIFGFLRRARVDVAQQPIQRERAAPDQVRRIFDGLWGHTIHYDDHCSAPTRS